MTSSEYRPPEYDKLLGGRTSQQLFECLQDRLPPQDLEPLPLDSCLERRLAAPIVSARDFHFLAPRIRRNLLDVVGRTSPGISANEDTVYELTFALTEGVQNALRNASGVRQIDLQRTSEGSLYMAVHNLGLNYPPGAVRRRQNGRLVRLGLVEASPEYAVPLEDDEHAWGLGLIGRLALQGDFSGMGFYSEKIGDIPVNGADQMQPISRLVFWSVHAKSESNGIVEVA